MPYYRAGDYYRGDGSRRNYAAGGFLGSIGKALGGAVKGFVTGGPLGAFKGAVASFVPSVAPRPQIAPMAMNLPSFGPGTPLSVPEPGVTGIVHRLAPGGKSGFGRLKKDGSFTDRRRPRMQVTNTRALKRAGRRVRGFLRIARQLGALPVSGGKGKKLFKTKRKCA